MWTELVQLFKSANNLLEVGVLFLLLWALMTFLRGSRGEGMLKALGLVLGVGFLLLRSLAIGYDLDRLTVVLDAIFQASVVALVVIFQPELRRGLALRIGEQWLNPTVSSADVVEQVAAACERLSRNKVGALISFERRESLKKYVETGTSLDAEVNSDLLRNLFWPGAPLHDGSVIIQGGRIAAAGCFLDLTENPDIPKSLGTRHRAALGLTEVSDAIVVVVSEETGTISFAVAGQLQRDLDKEALIQILTENYLNAVVDGGQGGLEAELPLAESATQSSPDASASQPPLPNKTTTRITRKIAT